MIIDVVLIHSTSLSLCPLLLECYIQINFKYRQSFKRGKCDFLSEHFEFVDCDIIPTGNITAASKYDLITDWKLPVTSAGLHSSVSYIDFFIIFSPHFEVKAKPLRTLYTQWHPTNIPPETWTPPLK